ncbi:MarR family transcriptional regulator [Kovacikia minuta CCNUW1]|uniref:MarR family winged helix-turn-helix transcriptional regulator n=1 Tax=Kovacikia minuta TaxID=2931930 RepID=UPI001CCD0D54|nr:MarR family transcriptional regulator [Kovacikia minuta]UBF24487.1 MarR family transcriptional regulator [Kovacikia minuta CCNUW1]
MQLLNLELYICNRRINVCGGRPMKTAPLDEARNKAWKLFLTTNVLVLELIEQELADAKLPPLSWYGVLWVLEQSPGHKKRLHELAQEVLLSRSNVTRLLDRLEAEGLLSRERCPRDRRGAFACITPAGLELRQRMWAVYSQAIAKYFTHYLSDEEVAVFTKAFERVLAGVRGEE